MPVLSVTKKIKVLIVDDSIFFRKTLEKGLSEDPRIEVAGMAVDADDALRKIQSLCPRLSLLWMSLRI